MKGSTLRLVSVMALTLSVFLTVWAMMRAANWDIGLGGLPFVLWAVSPYFVVLAVEVLNRKVAALPKIPAVYPVLSLLMLGVTFFAYELSLTGESSTESLIFLILPVFLYAGSFLVLALAFVISFVARSYAKRKA